MKTALVLSGGGVKGAYQLGVLRHLVDTENPDYDIYTGISVGALNAGLLSTGPLKQVLPDLEKVWLKDIKGNSSIWKHNLWYYVLAGIGLISLFLVIATVTFFLNFHKAVPTVFCLFAIASLFVPWYALKRTQSVYKSDPLRKLITKNLHIDKIKASGKTLRVGAVCYETGEYRTADETNEKIIDWIMASSAFPIFFPMVEIEGQHWTDGGVLNIAPLWDALELGATKIDVILTSPLDFGKEDKLGLSTQLERVLDLMSSEILRNDVTNCNTHAQIRIFAPLKSIRTSSLEFNPKKISEIYNIGKQDAAMTVVKVSNT